MYIFSLSDSPAALCDVCRGEIYPEDLAHFIGGFAVCPDCFMDFVFDYFEDCLITGADIRSARRIDTHKKEDDI